MNKKFLKKLLLIILLISIFIIVFLIFKNVRKKSQDVVENKSSKSTIAEKKSVDYDNILEITDNYFIQQTNDIYYNLNEYIGKSIKIEGFIYTYEDSENGRTNHAVIRNTPGCCGADGLAGLDIKYNKDYPEENTWVEVIGIVGKYMSMGNEIPVIKVESLTEKEEGTSFVTN